MNHKNKTQDPLVSTSRFLSLVLRHQPEVIGLTLDPQGWADIDTLIALSGSKRRLDRDLIARVVAGNDKQRFAISADGQRIRASQGHSVAVDLMLPQSTPPAWLYHGTATRFLDAIRREGLKPGSRQHVHLSHAFDTAVKVGGRHGRPHVLHVDAARMAADGHVFMLSENGVWLTATVPVEYIDFDATSRRD